MKRRDTMHLKDARIAGVKEKLKKEAAALGIIELRELFANPGSNNKKKTTHFFKINVIKPGAPERVEPFIF